MSTLLEPKHFDVPRTNGHGRGPKARLDSEADLQSADPDRQLQDASGTVQHGAAVPIESSVRLLDFRSGRELLSVTSLQTTARPLDGKTSISGHVSGSPFGFTFAFVPAPAPLPGKIRFWFDLSAWRGQRLSRLEAFDQLVALADGAELGHRIRIECKKPDGEMLTASPHPESVGFFAEMRSVLEPLVKARAVARATRVDPTVLGALSDDDASDVDLVFAIVHGRTYRQAAPDMKLRMSLERAAVRTLIESPAQPGPIAIHQREHSFRFLGSVVHISDVTFDFTHMTLDSDVKALKALVDAAGSESLEVSFVGGPEAELSVRVGTEPTTPRSETILSILDGISGRRLFRTAAEVDQFLEQERNEWDH